MKTHLTVALTGVPNVGKSTLFNMLTGLRQHVGNWPGKTVVQTKGYCSYQNSQIEFIDLPGAYSLNSVSLEEQVARDFLLFDDPDVMVVVLNAAQLSRGLVFLSEMLLLQKPIVVALNMVDVAAQENVTVDANKLAKVLGLPVVELIARKNKGVDQLLAAVVGASAQHNSFAVLSGSRQDVLHQTLAKLQELLQNHFPQKSHVFIATKILEGDVLLREALSAKLSADLQKDLHTLLINHETLVIQIAQERRDWTKEIFSQINYTQKSDVFDFTNKIDRITTHPVLGLGLFFAVIYLLFVFVFDVGAPAQEWLDEVLITPAASYFTTNFPQQFWSSFIADGLLQGVGLVLSFLPVLILFFFAMAFLEDVGYMSRAAYVMDRFMHKIGLHGRSFVPIFMGMGCNVPAVMATRVIDDKSSRLLTMLLIPLVPCAARFSVIAFFGTAFFVEGRALFSWSMIVLPFVAIALIGFIFSRTTFKGKQMPLIMELPLYHLPNFKGIFLQTWQRVWAFVKQAGGWIGLFTILIWLLSYHPSGDVGQSVLAKMTQFLNPVGELFGSDWRMMVALISSFIVKEQTIATLGVLTGATTEEATAQAVRNILTPEGALAFMVVQMLFIPCVSTIIMFKKEIGSWKWPLIGVALQAVVSLFCGVVLFQLLKWL